jgi:hypothetical protein
VSTLFFQVVMPYGLTGRYQLLEKHMVCIFRCQYLPMSLSRHHKTEQHWHFHHCDNLKSHIKHPSMSVSFITFQNTNFVKPVQNEFILIYSVVWTPASHVQNTHTQSYTIQFKCICYCILCFELWVWLKDICQYTPLLIWLNMKHSLNDGGPLQTSYEECVWLGAVRSHDLTALHCKVVEWVTQVMLRLRFEANQWAIVKQHKVAGAPVLDVFPCNNRYWGCLTVAFTGNATNFLNILTGWRQVYLIYLPKISEVMPGQWNHMNIFR